MLLAPIQPVYPAIAKVTRTEGTVVMEAVISKAGRIESLHAVSGPEMLRRAALDAVSAARYKPYLLNGEPTEVQTTITVNFRLGG
jgi:protein TonB